MSAPQCGVNLDGSVREIICPFGFFGGRPHIGVCRSCREQTAEAVAYKVVDREPIGPCDYRETREDILPCCKKLRLFCRKAGVFIQEVSCVVCQTDPTWIERRLAKL